MILKLCFWMNQLYGLDSVSKIAVRDFIKKINREKNTPIILTTHDTGDIEALTKRIILIGKGKVLVDGNLEGLIKQYSNKEIKLKYSGNIGNLDDGVKILEKDGNLARLEIDENKISLADSIVNISKKVKINDMEVKNTSIDNIVARLYKDYKI